MFRLLMLLLSAHLALVPAGAGAATISGMAPASAAPDSQVVVTGGPFTKETRVFFGDLKVIPESIAPHQLTFAVPSLPEGLYVVSVGEEAAQAAGPIFSFQLIELTPRIESTAPTSLDSCSLQQGEAVVLTGEFPPQARVLLDGAVVPADKTGKTEITFTVPALKGGMHQVEVVGHSNRRSLPHSLFVDSVPRIESIGQGEDRVTSYEVVIQGENLLFNSTLVVDGTATNQAAGDSVPGNSTLERLAGEDYVRYVDCRSLIYVRHPVTRVPHTVTLQVVNPGGEESPVYVAAIP